MVSSLKLNSVWQEKFIIISDSGVVITSSTLSLWWSSSSNETEIGILLSLLWSDTYNIIIFLSTICASSVQELQPCDEYLLFMWFCGLYEIAWGSSSTWIRIIHTESPLSPGGFLFLLRSTSLKNKHSFQDLLKSCSFCYSTMWCICRVHCCPL